MGTAFLGTDGEAEAQKGPPRVPWVPQLRCLATQTRAPSQLLGACPDGSPFPSHGGGGGGAPESSTWELRST